MKKIWKVTKTNLVITKVKGEESDLMALKFFEFFNGFRHITRV